MLMDRIYVKIQKLYIVRHVIVMDHCALPAKIRPILNKMSWNAWSFVEMAIAMKFRHQNV